MTRVVGSVIAMRNVGTLTLALFAILMAVGFTSSAQAAPVVDQYTEELPSPGGPVPVNPDNTGKPGQEDTAGPGTGSGIVTGGEDSSSGNAPAVPADQAGKKDDSGKAQGADESDSDQENSTGTVATSGSDDGGDGMGWVFPAALVLVAAVIAGVAISRRNRGNLAI